MLKYVVVAINYKMNNFCLIIKFYSFHSRCFINRFKRNFFSDSQLNKYISGFYEQESEIGNRSNGDSWKKVMYST